MTAIARLGDTTKGTCYSHTSPIDVGGTIITGSSNDFADGYPVARLGDIIKSDCGHYSTIITASSNSFSDGLGVARLGDIGSGEYKCTIITGSPNCNTT